MIFVIVKYLTFFVKGNENVDQVLTIFLSTSIFLGGLIGFVLDNLVPGNNANISIL